MIKDKTCGECKYHDIYSCLKLKDVVFIGPTRLACIRFCPKKPTIGDIIRKEGNRDFAEYFVYETGAMFASTLIVDKTFDTYEEATTATEDYLNAPAEREVNNEQ